MVHTRHFSRFTAHQRTARLQTAFGNTINDAGCGIHIQFASRIVVEEKQRLSALNYEVVDAHRDQIDANGVMAFQIHRQTQFCAYAIRAGNQYRFTIFLRQCAQRTEATQTTHHFRATRFLYYAFDSINQSITCININTGIFVAKRGFIGHCLLPHMFTCSKS